MLGSQSLQSSYFSFNKLVTLRKLADEQSSLNDILQKSSLGRSTLLSHSWKAFLFPLRSPFFPLRSVPCTLLKQEESLALLYTRSTDIKKQNVFFFFSKGKGKKKDAHQWEIPKSNLDIVLSSLCFLFPSPPAPSKKHLYKENFSLNTAE